MDKIMQAKIREFIILNKEYTDESVATSLNINLNMGITKACVTKIRQRMGLRKSKNGRPAGKSTHKPIEATAYLGDETQNFLKEVAAIAEQNK